MTTILTTVLLIVLCLSIITVVRDAVSDFARGLQIMILFLCGTLIGGLVFTHLPKRIGLSWSGKGIPESESFLRKQQAALWRLTKSKNIHGGVLEEALREATEAAAHTLEVERASVWLFNESKSSLRCHDLFERSANRHSRGVELAADDYPTYFHELSAERVIAATEARNDFRTEEFAPRYLRPLGIASRLDAPIQSGGRMVGVICHEHVGTVHEWTLEEQQFANSMANLVSLALEATERLQAESALRKSEERVRSIIDTALDAVIGMDEKGHILDWNRRAETVFGWTREEAIGRELGDTIIPPQYRDAHRRGLQHFLQSGEGPVLNKRIEITGLRRDGSEFPIELAISPLKTATGYEFNAFVQDIGERKQAEDDLRGAKESAEAANRAKSQFLANMSHEIRTPMNGVLGMIDLMLATTLTSKQRRFAETVRQSGHNLLQIVNEILDFAKVEAGKLTLEQVDFDLYETIEEVIDLVAERAQAKGLTLACEIDKRVPVMLKGDPGRLRQILINLLGNAIKFTEHGEVVVRVQIEAESQDTPPSDDRGAVKTEHAAPLDAPSPMPVCHIRVSVTDTGIGIPAHAQANIFEPFAQGDGSTTRKYGGTGLGLAIVKQLAEMMHGTVAVQSIPNRGSTFSFTARLQRSAVSSSTASGRRYDLDGLRVLIVDSNPTTRSILENQLKAWHMHYGAAESGTEALAFLQYKSTRGTPYDLVILDSQLSDMEALTLARSIRSRAGGTGLRLVMLSAMAQTEDAEALQQAGIQAILTKPFRQSRLYDCLATVMGGSPEEQAALRRTVPQPVEVRTLGHGRILLAEDNPVNQEVALGMLEALGCHADLASNGREVLEALKQKTYDLILMDCQMPEMDGFEATKHIREMEARRSALEPRPSDLEQFPHLPIIAVTAHAITGDRERCVTAGMDDYLSKPFVQDQLQALLLRWLPPRGVEATPEQERSTFDVRHFDPEPPASNFGPRTSNPELRIPTLPPSPCGDVSTIDPRAWESIRSLQRPGQPDMLCKVIDKYLSSSRQLIDTMRTAVPQRDAEALHRTAHSLKSSSATLGARRLAALCKEVEAMGRTNALNGVPALWEKIEAEYALVQEALTVELNQVRP
ncbi:MAG TPA: response regulator [Nitrospiraceae bacterium]|nr:response regulator [Nitrospiraceae bacterium]